MLEGRSHQKGEEMKAKQCMAWLLALLLFPGVVFGQTVGPAASVEEMKTSLDAFVQKHGEETTGVAFSVFTADEILYERFHGYANREERLPMDENTVIEWGSVTKLLTWVSVMQMVE